MAEKERVAEVPSDLIFLPRISIKTYQLFGKLTELFRRFIVFEDPLFYNLSVIYVLLTYFHEIFDEIPYLGISGLKASGKSRLGALLEGVCFRSLNSAEISDASLYRVISQVYGGLTMIIDEADDLGSPTRRGILLRVLRSGYHRKGNVIRCGPNGTIERFSTFCPKIIINENGIQDPPLESRTIPIHMIKSNSPLEKFRFLKIVEEFKEIKKLIRSFSEDYRDLVSDRYFSFNGVDGILGRDEEVWTPIIIIADILSTISDAPSLKDQMLTLARNTILERKRKQLIGNRDLQILESTRAFVEQKEPLNCEGLFVAEHLRDFIKVDWDIPGLNTEAVARVLNRNKIIRGLKRPLLEVSEGGLIKKVQKTCYLLDREILWRLTNESFE